MEIDNQWVIIYNIKLVDRLTDLLQNYSILKNVLDYLRHLIQAMIYKAPDLQIFLLEYYSSYLEEYSFLDVQINRSNRIFIFRKKIIMIRYSFHAISTRIMSHVQIYENNRNSFFSLNFLNLNKYFFFEKFIVKTKKKFFRSNENQLNIVKVNNTCFCCDWSLP